MALVFGFFLAYLRQRILNFPRMQLVPWATGPFWEASGSRVCGPLSKHSNPLPTRNCSLWLLRLTFGDTCGVGGMSSFTRTTMRSCIFWIRERLKSLALCTYCTIFYCQLLDIVSPFCPSMYRESTARLLMHYLVFIGSAFGSWLLRHSGLLPQFPLSFWRSWPLRFRAPMPVLFIPGFGSLYASILLHGSVQVYSLLSPAWRAPLVWFPLPSRWIDALLVCHVSS